jgi:DeoR/GlpR family transcriptional regulator of sugar metabolism
VSDLSKTFNVTEETIRRDLEKLEKRGLVRKTYGGAVYGQDMNLEGPFTFKDSSNLEEIILISKKVAELVNNGDSIILDASSVALNTARALKQKRDLSVITNSVEILMTFAYVKTIKVFSTGGSLRESAYALVGSAAEQMLAGFHVDKAFLSCAGIHRDSGITETNVQDAEIKKLMRQAADQVILMADKSKFNQKGFIRFMDFTQVQTIVTSKTLSAEWQTYLTQNGIKLILV